MRQNTLAILAACAAVAFYGAARAQQPAATPATVPDQMPFDIPMEIRSPPIALPTS
ncbi:hypothetical protein [Bradyrhizobium archetypum]|uniref:hypothetical protein n=1 Tax=Bradyrhizobium archetypum TaxID=2721160 RepID=UPI001F22D546|nr:hypothetical protein [Bradyrhizobium archetypum]